MGKDGLGKNGWVVISIVGAASLWAIIAFLFWNTKPSLSDEVWFAVFILYIWVRGHVDEQGDCLKEQNERLKEQNDRLLELESRIEEIESQSQS